MCDSIIVNPFVKRRPTSSVTSPLASFKEVPPPPTTRSSSGFVPIADWTSPIVFRIERFLLCKVRGPISTLWLQSTRTKIRQTLVPMYVFMLIPITTEKTLLKLLWTGGDLKCTTYNFQRNNSWHQIRALNKSVQKMVDFGLSKFFLPQNVNGIWVSQGEHLPRHISPTNITTIKTVNGTLQYPKVVW